MTKAPIIVLLRALRVCNQIPKMRTEEINRLRALVEEIRSYYALNRDSMSDQIVVSKSMVAFALFPLSEDELQVLFKELIQQGYLLEVKRDRLIFPVSFVDIQF